MLHLLIITSILGTSPAKPQQQIAFCSTVSGNQSIFLVNLDGTGLRRLTKGHAEDNDPVWSPDGSTIVFNGPASQNSIRALGKLEPETTQNNESFGKDLT